MLGILWKIWGVYAPLTMELCFKKTDFRAARVIYCADQQIKKNIPIPHT